MEQFPGNDYVVVLRKNRAFKVSLKNEKCVTSYEILKGIFERIINLVGETGPNVGILTTDDRRIWAKVLYK